MTFKELLAQCQQSGVAFRHESQATYYWNLWVETMRHDNKVGASHDFDAYIIWMKKQ